MMTAAQYRAEARRVTREREAAEKAWRKAQDWGLFVWEAENRYRRAQAIKIYKTKAGAERAASRLYDQDRSSSIVARAILD
jgi:hypothetical protein